MCVDTIVVLADITKFRRIDLPGVPVLIRELGVGIMVLYGLEQATCRLV
jgi:hypothetical protein